MKGSLFLIVYRAGVLLLMTGVAIGCVSRAVPISHTHVEAIDDGHGLLLGTHRLSADDQKRLSDLKWSSNMKWWIEEVTQGKQSLVVRVPLDGAFAVKLPAGSYRVTDIVIDSSRGKWHTALPTTFEIRSRECTSLGTSELQFKVGLWGGWIARQVLNAQELGDDGRERMAGERTCPTSMAQLESPVTRSIRLGLYEKRLERF